MKIFVVVVLLAASTGFASDKLAAPHHSITNPAFHYTALSCHQGKTKDEVVGLVNAAAEYLKKNGKEAAFKEFNKTDGQFTRGASYIAAVDYSGVHLATGNPHRRNLNGVNILASRDDDGTYMVKEQIAKANAGGGWTRFKLQNHVSNKLECKHMYVMPVLTDMYIGSGYYYPPNANGKCE